MIDAILSDHRHGHSEWQIDHVITARCGGTLYGCYRQAVRELHKRWRGLREQYRARALAELDDAEATPPTGRRAEIEATERRLAAIEAAGVIRDTEREFLRFYGQAVACRRALGLRDDQTMPDEMRQRLEREFWEHQLRSMAAVDFITTGRIGRGTVELFAATDPAMRRRLAAEILNPERHGELIDWYLNHEPQLPEPVLLPDTQSQELLTCVSKPFPLLPASGTTAGLPCSLAKSTAAD